MTAATGLSIRAPALTALPPRASFLRGPFSRTAWRDTAFIVAGGSWMAVLALAAVLQMDSVFILATIFGIPLLPQLLSLASAFQRGRFRGLLGVELRTEPLSEGRPSWPGLLRAVRSGNGWRQLGYHLVAAPLFALAGVGIVLLWITVLGMALIFAYASLMPPGSPLHPANWVDRDLLNTAVGLVGLWVTPWLAGTVAALDLRAAAALLGPDRAVELEQRVAGLTESRSALVQAVDAERRRIERDLHDGAQQRLVSLAINLGLARAELPDLPQSVRAVIESAHEEAKAALAELRDLVRGLHPAVLDDRGLDAALSGIAARAPLPVRLTVSVPERAAPAVEAVAYFVVAEALTNIAKHAKAAEARVEVERIGARLRLRISDDGVGGADPALGSGLAGLARRARSVDGTFSLSSPVGGPTVIIVELPCVL
jgi:signal transduction histidine kinase